jgi:16S rRNA (guanine966-N2)-methyltransferase
MPKPTAGQLRIIGGQWKRTPIVVPDVQGLRPTPDRVRETLFNWLGQTIPGWDCLDLFAGAGGLGFEAGSRGAGRVVMVESDPLAVKSIAQTIDKLRATDRLQVVRARAQDWLAQCRQDFDLVFLDPPFGRGLMDPIMPAVVSHLKPDGMVYLESDQAIGHEWAQNHGLSILRADKAGAVHYHLLQHCAAQGDQDAKSRIPGDI